MESNLIDIYALFQWSRTGSASHLSQYPPLQDFRAYKEDRGKTMLHASY